MLLLNHLRNVYNLKYYLLVHSTLNVLIPCPQTLKPLLLFSLSSCSFRYQICSFTKYTENWLFYLEMLLWTVICLLIMRLTYPLFHPFSESIDYSIDLFIMCLLFWTFIAFFHRFALDTNNKSWQCSNGKVNPLDFILWLVVDHQ